MQKVWNKWLNITKKTASFTADILLSIIFIVLIVPLGKIMVIFFRKSLKGHNVNKQTNTYWLKRNKLSYDLKYAKEQ